MGLYESSAKLMDQGVVSGLDMSPEAALCKLSVLLGKGYPSETVGQYMQIDQRGEMSTSLYTADFGGGKTDDRGVYQSIPLQITGAAKLDKERIQHSVLRFFYIEPPEGATQLKFSIRAFINLALADRSTPDTFPQFAGSSEVDPQEAPCNRLLDTTQTARTVIEPGTPVFVTVVTDQERVKWKRLSLLVYAKS
jgi:hypothetical protein